MGGTKVGDLKTVNAVLRRALKPGMPLPQFKLVVGALEPQLKPGMQAQLTTHLPLMQGSHKQVY